jgi:hypothetical protein
LLWGGRCHRLLGENEPWPASFEKGNHIAWKARLQTVEIEKPLAAWAGRQRPYAALTLVNKCDELHCGGAPLQE